MGECGRRQPVLRDQRQARAEDPEAKGARRGCQQTTERVGHSGKGKGSTRGIGPTEENVPRYAEQPSSYQLSQQEQLWKNDFPREETELSRPKELQKQESPRSLCHDSWNIELERCGLGTSEEKRGSHDGVC